MEANICLPHRQMSGGLKDTNGALKEEVGGVFGFERYAHQLQRAHKHSCSTACRYVLRLAMLTPHVKQQCRLLVPLHVDNLCDRVM